VKGIEICFSSLSIAVPIIVNTPGFYRTMCHASIETVPKKFGNKNAMYREMELQELAI
jgi:hypothetical protein